MASMPARFWAILFAVAAFAAMPVAARTLYAATAPEGGKSSPGGGRLYVVDPLTCKSRLVGMITAESGAPLAIDGLAMHPRTGVLYGITSRSDAEPKLVTLNPRTALAKIIGPLGVRGADIHFDANGVLYIWILEANRLGTVDLASGAVTPLAPSGLGAAGGMAVDSRGRAFVTAGSKQGRVIDEVDASTGNLIGGMTLIDSSVLRAVHALTFSPAGSLLAVNQPGGAGSRELVSIDTETGNVTRIGALPDEVDAIAFDDGPVRPRSKMGLLALMLAVMLALQVAGMLRWRNKK